MMIPSIEARRMREAARGVNTFLTSARSEAIASGRPVGVYFRPSQGVAGAEACDTLIQVEVPPPFAGFNTNSTVQVEAFGTDADPYAGYLVATFSEPIPDKYVQYNDTIELNFQGAVYRITSGTGDASTAGTAAYRQGNGFRLQLQSPGVRALPWKEGTPSPEMPYKIARRQQPSASRPFTLPTGAVVDLAYSGVGNNGVFTSAAGITLMFSPSGSVSVIDLNNGDSPTPPTLPIHFLIGKSENLPVADNGGNHNYLELQNFWVTVGPQTGQVVTSENAGGASVDVARTFAKDARGMGGK